MLGAVHSYSRLLAMDGQVRDDIKTSFALNYPTLYMHFQVRSVPISNLNIDSHFSGHNDS